MVLVKGGGGYAPSIHIKLVRRKNLYTAYIIFDEPYTGNLDVSVIYYPYWPPGPENKPMTVFEKTLKLENADPVTIKYTIDSDRDYCTYVQVVDGNTGYTYVSNMVCVTQTIFDKPKLNKWIIALAGIASAGIGYAIGRSK